MVGTTTEAAVGLLHVAAAMGDTEATLALAHRYKVVDPLGSLGRPSPSPTATRS